MRTLILLLATIYAGPVWSDTVIEVETPALRHVYANCSISESHIARHGTTAIVISSCGVRSTQPQVPVWTPDPHPDGLPMRFESVLVTTTKHGAFQQCELTDYAVTPFGSSQRWQCLDDPVAESMQRRR
jgi:hypothetical protein